MPNISTFKTSFGARALAMAGLLIGAAMAGAAPAAAQDDDDQYSYQGDIVVQGHYGRSLRDAESLSQAVNYSDLDLRYREDRQILRQRISWTARDLCRRLGEDDNSRLYGTSCRDEAVRDAMRRVGTVEQYYVPRDSLLIEPRYASRYRNGWDR